MLKSGYNGGKDDRKMCLCHTHLSWQGDHCRSPVHPLLSRSMDMLCATNDQILTMREVATYLKLAKKTA